MIESRETAKVSTVQCALAECVHIRRADGSQGAELNKLWQPTCGFLTYQTSVLWIIGSWQCYRTGPINKLCEMYRVAQKMAQFYGTP